MKPEFQDRKRITTEGPAAGSMGSEGKEGKPSELTEVQGPNVDRETEQKKAEAVPQVPPMEPVEKAEPKSEADKPVEVEKQTEAASPGAGDGAAKAEKANDQDVVDSRISELKKEIDEQ